MRRKGEQRRGSTGFSIRIFTVLLMVSAAVGLPGTSPTHEAAAATPSAAITEFTVPINGSDPLGIATGPDGNLWMADSNDFDPQKVEKMSTSGVFTGIPFPSFDNCCVDPGGITVGPDGNLWFTAMTTGANYIGRITTGGTHSEYGGLTPNSIPTGITRGPGSDNNLWFTEYGAGQIGRIDATTKAVTEFATTTPEVTTTGTAPYGITVGPDNNIWFTEQSAGVSETYVSAMNTSGVMVAKILISTTGRGLSGITKGSDNKIWFTMESGQAIGRIDPTSKTFLGEVGDGLRFPSSITSGSDGNLYFVEIGQGGSIGRLNPNNIGAGITHFVVPTTNGFSMGAPPTGIATGPDNNIWFTENSGKFEGSSPSPIHNVGKLTLGTVVSPSSSSFNFGAKAIGATSSSQTLTITSKGASNVTFSSFNVSNSDFKITNNGCSGKTLVNSDPASPTCTITLTFTPSASGTRNGTLTVNDSAGSQVINLTGSGFVVSGAASFSPTSLTFGNVTVGTASLSQKITLTNAGNASLTVSGVSLTGTNPGDFKKTSDACSSAVLAVSATCNVTIAFQPTDAGPRTATMTVNDTAQDSPQSIPLSGQGLPAPTPTPTPTPTQTSQPGPSGGYWLVARDGGIFNYGSAQFFGSAGGIHLNKPIVGMASTPTGKGYWLVASDGGIFNYGDAQFFGSAGGIHLNKPIVGMASTPTGKGYWLVATDGGIFNYGDAKFFGSAGGINLNKPIAGMASTPTGNGYWLVATDGGIFNYGDARFFGSAGSINLNKPIVGMAATASGGGYWFVATDGGIFNYGDAGFFGSAGSIRLNQPIAGMGAAPAGNGYWLVATDGGIFNYGGAGFFGSAGSITLNSPIVEMASSH